MALSLARDFRIPRATGALIIAALMLAGSCSAAGHKVVVVVANRVVLSDLQNSSLTNISRMLFGGSPGLVSPNCVSLKNDYSVLLTAAAGSPCRGGLYVAECYDANEVLPDGQLAGVAFRSRTGITMRKGSAVFLGVAQAARENSESARLAGTGVLGDALHKAGKRTWAIGNADIPPDVFDRSVAVLAADSKGRIDVGWLADVPSLDAIDGLERADLVVINFGETTRLDESKASISDNVYPKRWADALKDLDSLLGELIHYADGQDVTIVLVSFSPPSDGPWIYLTPMVVYPSSTRGLLTSPSTRTPGLVAASDFAATILRLMDVPHPGGLMGRAAEPKPVKSGIVTLETMSSRVTANRILEVPMLWTVAIIGIIACTLSALIVGFGLVARANRVARIGLLIGLSCMPAMLVAALSPGGALGYALATALVVTFMVAVAWGIGRNDMKRTMVEGSAPFYALPVVVVYWAAAACILIDSAFGGTLCKFSLPSSYQISGFRYYGIGNEYAGVLIAVAALAVLFSGKAIRDKAILPVGLIVMVFLGAGALGANFVAVLVATVTFGLLWTANRRGGFGLRHVVFWFALGLVLSAGCIVIDWKTAGDQGTHASQTGAMANAVGGSYWFDLTAKKLLMNFRLTSSNTAERAFFGFLPFIGLWFWKIHGRVRGLLGGDKSVLAGVGAVIVGAVVAFITEDSGIVMASVMVAMTVGILLYSLLEEGTRPWAGS